MPMSPDDYELMLQRQRMGAFAPPEPTAGAFAPLSDSGPIPGQEWPQTYDPQGAARFGEVAVDAGLGAFRALAPPMPDLSGEQFDARMEAMPRLEDGSIDREGALGEGLKEFGGQAMFAALPRGAGGVLPSIGKKGAAAIGAGLGIGGTASAGAVPSDDVKDLQRRLQAAGYYKGKIDGEMGLITREANDAYQSDLRAKESSATERARVEAEAAKASASAAEANARMTESKRLADEAVSLRQRRELAEEMLKKVEDDVDPWRKALRGYSTPLGIAAGMVTGGIMRKGVNKASDLLSANRATRADNLMKGVSRQSTADRAAKVNQFWSEGGAPEVPFKPNPGQIPAIKSNAGAPGTDALYQPSRGKIAGIDSALTGLALAEGGMGRFYLGPKADAELEAARKDYKDDPAASSINRMQTAKDNQAIGNFVTNMGLSGAATFAGSALKFGRKPSRPNVNKAESERTKIDERLTAQTRPSAKDGGKLTDAEVVDDLKALPAPKRKFEPGVRPETPAHGTAVQMAKDPNWQEAAAKYVAVTGKGRIDGPGLVAIAKRADPPVDLSDHAASRLARRLNTSPDFMRNLERLKKDLSSERSARDGAAAKAALRKE